MGISKVRTFTRTVGTFAASTGCAAAMLFSTAVNAQAANTALMINGIAGQTQLSDLVMGNVLGGMFRNYVRQNIVWPQQANPITGPNSLRLDQSIAQGVTNVDAALNTALAQLGPGEHVTIVGLSAGSLVADAEMAKLAADPNAPDKSKLNFVVVADSSRILFNKNRYDAIIKYQYRPPVDTKYDTTVVAAEYDGFADFPDRPLNFLAVANAFAGEIVQHVPNMLTDLSTVPSSNISVKTNSLGGVTTSYLIPAAHLPLVVLIPALAPQEAQLKAKIDTAYVRNDGKNSAAATPVAATADVSAPAVSAAESAAAAPVAAPATKPGAKIKAALKKLAPAAAAGGSGSGQPGAAKASKAPRAAASTRGSKRTATQ